MCVIRLIARGIAGFIFPLAIASNAVAGNFTTAELLGVISFMNSMEDEKVPHTTSMLDGFAKGDIASVMNSKNDMVVCTKLLEFSLSRESEFLHMQATAKASGFRNVIHWARKCDAVIKTYMLMESGRENVKLISTMSSEQIMGLPDTERAALQSIKRMSPYLLAIPEEDITLLRANYDKLESVF